MYCDAHAHLADERLRTNLTAILQEAEQQGIDTILSAAAHRSDWDFLLKLPSSPSLSLPVALGIHPWYAGEWNPQAKEELRRLCQDGRLAAIGEIGLDFQNGRENAEQQLTALSEQLQLAREFKLPVIIHIRKAWTELFALFNHLNIAQISGICHNFSGSREIARQALQLGLSLSFGGPLTNPNSRRQREVAARIPLDRLLTETDAPDCPVLSRLKSCGHPADVRETAAVLAEIREITLEELTAATADNLHKILSRN